MGRPRTRAGNLPVEATSFVGRRRELGELRKRLATGRLISLVGPGGVGKSRLALRAATDLGRGFTGGAWLVELAEIQDPGLVANAFIAALDLRDQAAEPLPLLLSHLRDRDLLLVVDNCEHLLEATAHVIADIVRTAPGARVIATSREPLTIPGEHVVPVPPLDLPAPHAAGPTAQLRQNEAVMLFTERAEAAAGTFALTAANGAVVADLCRRLDGLPLAIELAAVRTRVLTVEQILDRIADRFGLLVGGSRAALPRHQTLRTTIDWSHDLLDENERTLLRRLAVFAGRFTLEDVEGICSWPEAPMLELLASLVGKSLVTKQDSGPVAWYRLHETMREYAELKLCQAGEDERLHRRCDEHYFMTCTASVFEGRYHLVERLEWMDLEIDNVRAVLRRCREGGDPHLGIHLAASLGWYWMTRATTEGIRWLEGLLGSVADDAEHGWGRFLRGFLSVLQADPVAARPNLARAAELARATNDLPLLSQALSMASVAEIMAGDRVAGTHLLEEAGVVTEPLNDLPATLGVLQAQSLSSLFQGDIERLEMAASEGARLARAANDLYTLEVMLLNLGGAALLRGDLRASGDLLKEGLQIARQIDDRIAQFYLVGGLACHAAAQGQARLAAQLLGATNSMRRELGVAFTIILSPLLDQAGETARTKSGEVRFEADFGSGGGMNRGAAIRLALGEPDPKATPAGGPAGPLGKRESEVARLVAEGLSNKEIGARLFISERTVESHVHGIMNKLGFNSRAQIASWMGASM